MGLTVVYTRKIDLPKADFDSSRPKEFKLKNKGIKIAMTILVLVFMIWVINLVAIKPYMAELYYFKGARYNVGKNYDKALPNFQYAAQLDSHNGRILHALGTTYYHLNIQDEAQKILQRTKYYFNDRNIYRNLGLSYTESGKYQEAEKEFRHAIYLDPKFTKAYADLAYLYAKQEDYDKAIVEWKKILEIDPDFYEKYNVLYFMGMAYQKKEMPDKALDYFVQALVLVPEGSPVESEIEEEISKIYGSQLDDQGIYRFPISRE
jgi:tetratricopeptide (TPR) repeat protein